MTRYYQKNNYMVGVCNDGTEFLFDCEYYDIVSEYKWINHKNNIESYGKNCKNTTLAKLISLQNNNINNLKALRKNSKILDYRKTNLFFNNIYIEKNGYYEVTTISDEIFKIDKSDYDIVKKYRWYINSQGYPEALINSKSLKLHRYLLNKIDWNGYNEVVDHINRDKLDNRRNNLRIVTQKENVRNSGTRNTNTSGVTNVEWNKDMKCWRATKTIDGVKYQVGWFTEIEDAKNAVLIFENCIKNKEEYIDLSTYKKRQSSTGYKYIYNHKNNKYMVSVVDKYIGVFDNIETAIEARDKYMYK